MKRKTAVATAAMLALSATGCGSSALTRAELTKQANAICKQRNAQIVVLRRQHRGDIRGMVAAGLPLMTTTADQLRGLKPPASAKADYGRFVAIQELYAAELKRFARGGRAQDNPTRTHELMHLVEQLGLRACQ